MRPGPVSRRSVLTALASTFLPGVLTAQGASVQMIGSEGEAARYWPRWRGPSGQGLVTGTNYVDTWSASENVLWRTAVPGRGNSSPIVWRDRIIVTTAYDGGRRVSVLAFQRASGAPLWETFAPQARSDRAHEKNGHASSTPVTDGERVYASFGSTGVMAVDLNGALVWQRDLGRLDAYHGTAGSPLLYNDRLILYQDQFSSGFVTAIDTRTGRTIWRTSRSASVGWGSPVALRVDTHDELLVFRKIVVYG
jgi:outer membrane protein assembly factor BamB